MLQNVLWKMQSLLNCFYGDFFFLPSKLIHLSFHYGYKSPYGMEGGEGRASQQKYWSSFCDVTKLYTGHRSLVSDVKSKN